MESAKGDGVKYEGFVIEMDVDVRDVLGTKGDLARNIKGHQPFPFTHRVYRDDQTVVVAPLLDFDQRNDLDHRVELLKRQDVARTAKAKETDPDAHIEDNRPIYEAFSDSLNKFVDRQVRVGVAGEDAQAWQTAVMHYVLKFPSGVQLDGEKLACNAGKKNLELKALGQMYFAPVDKIPKNVSVRGNDDMEYEVPTTAEVFKGKLIWMVADMNQRNRKLGKTAAEMEAQTDAAAAMLESMGLS